MLQNRDNPVLSAGASLSAPLFLGGQLQAQVEIRTAEQKQALAEYGAHRLARLCRSRERAVERFALDEREPSSAKRSSRTRARSTSPNVRFRVGSGDLRAVQQQALALHAARTALLRVQAERLVQRVNLHLALGGSFTTTSP